MPNNETLPTFEQFNEIADLRPYFLSYPDREALTAACLHFLGDKAQLDWRNNGYHTYRFESGTIAQIPPCAGRYQVCRKDGSVHFECWNGTGWAYNDKVIMWWKPIDLPKKLKKCQNTK